MEHFPSGSPRHQPSFVKIYLPDQTSTTLKDVSTDRDLMLYNLIYGNILKGIPPAFIENFNGKIPKRISLNNLSGRVWPAKLGYIDKKLHITDGWTPYVKEHSLKCGEFVVFTYLKKSTFLVKAYGVDGLIKQEPLYKRVRGISPNVAPVRNMRFFKTLTVFKRQLCYSDLIASVQNEYLGGSDYPKLRIRMIVGTWREIEGRESKRCNFLSKTKVGVEGFIFPAMTSFQSKNDVEGKCHPPLRIPRKGVPKHIIDSYALTLPQKIKLRGDKGKSVKTKLRQMKDRVILGFGLAKFWKRNGVQPGDRLEFEVIRGDDDKIEEIVMKNLSQSEEFGRDY